MICLFVGCEKTRIMENAAEMERVGVEYSTVQVGLYGTISLPCQNFRTADDVEDQPTSFACYGENTSTSSVKILKNLDASSSDPKYM